MHYEAAQSEDRNELGKQNHGHSPGGCPPTLDCRGVLQNDEYRQGPKVRGDLMDVIESPLVRTGLTGRLPAWIVYPALGASEASAMYALIARTPPGTGDVN